MINGVTYIVASLTFSDIACYFPSSLSFLFQAFFVKFRFHDKNCYFPSYFLLLLPLPPQSQVYLLIDEVQTGAGASGKFWMHQHFHLPQPPDLVTFAKKMLTGGFYMTPEMAPTEVNLVAT